MADGEVRFTADGPIASITFDRPEARNAMTWAMYESLMAICERLREMGVIEHATGDFSNVLKVKPPLCISRASADFFVDRLDQVLSDGW